MTVLVGVDGSKASLDALDLALHEAALRGTTVRALCVDNGGSHPAWIDAPRPMTLDPHDALRTARAHTSAEFSAEVLPGDPAAVLVRQSAGADLLSVGHRGHGGFPEFLLGSVAATVAAHAHCPVLVTRGPARVDGNVGVGVDGSPAAEAAVAFAFGEAAVREVGLVALHVAAGPYLSGPTDALLFDPEAERAEHHRLLSAALEPWRQRCPEVPVREELRWDRPSRALVDLSQRMSLVVVGARGRSGLPGRRLGAVTHALLHHAACTVAVLPT